MLWMNLIFCVLIVKCLGGDPAEIGNAANRHSQPNEPVSNLHASGEHDDGVTSGNQPGGDEIINGDQPDGDEIINGDQPDGDEITNGDQPDGDEITNGDQPVGDEVINGDQPDGDEVINGDQPDGDEIIHGDQQDGDEVINGDQRDDDEVINGDQRDDDEVINGEQRDDDEDTNGDQPGGDEVTNGVVFEAPDDSFSDIKLSKHDIQTPPEDTEDPKDVTTPNRLTSDHDLREETLRPSSVDNVLQLLVIPLDTDGQRNYSNSVITSNIQGPDPQIPMWTEARLMINGANPTCQTASPEDVRNHLSDRFTFLQHAMTTPSVSHNDHFTIITITVNPTVFDAGVRRVVGNRQLVLAVEGSFPFLLQLNPMAVTMILIFQADWASITPEFCQNFVDEDLNELISAITYYWFEEESALPCSSLTVVFVAMLYQIGLFTCVNYFFSIVRDIIVRHNMDSDHRKVAMKRKPNHAENAEYRDNSRERRILLLDLIREIYQRGFNFSFFADQQATFHDHDKSGQGLKQGIKHQDLKQRGRSDITNSDTVNTGAGVFHPIHPAPGESSAVLGESRDSEAQQEAVKSRQGLKQGKKKSDKKTDSNVLSNKSDQGLKQEEKNSNTTNTEDSDEASADVRLSKAKRKHIIGKEQDPKC